MSDRFPLLAALFAAHSDPVTFETADGTQKSTRDHDWIEAEAAYVSPYVGDGYTAFVFGFQDDVPEDDWTHFKLKPTAVLYHDGKKAMIACWALDEVASATDIGGVAAKLGMQSLDEPIPLPHDTAWRLIYADDQVYATVPELIRVYGEAKPALEQPDAPPPWDDEPEAAAPVLETYGDAKVLAPYVEASPALAQEMIISLGANKESQRWKPQAMPIGAFVAKLCRHEVGAKDGPSYVLGDMVPGRRLKTAVKALYAVGLDIDTGTSIAQIEAALKDLGCLAVRYSTHSHLKSITEFKRDRLTKWAEKEADGADFEDDTVLRRFLTEVEKWDPEIVASATYKGDEHQDRGIMAIVEHKAMPKHRIVVPFAKPFVISEQTGTQADAMKKWGKVPTALAQKLGVPLDESCLDPSRLFYFPRHAKGKPFDVSLVGGPLFDWTSLVLEDPFEAEIAKLTKGTSKSQTPAGRDLGRWSMKRAHGFQIVQAIEDNAPEKMRNQTASGWEIECPFDEEHSNPGDPDDRACMAVNAGDGPSEWFSVRCLHETCKSKTNLDMVGKMVEDGWFAREVLDDESYNAVIDGDNIPNPEVVKKIEDQDNAREAFEKAIDDLPARASQKQIDEVLRVIHDAALGAVGEDYALGLLKTKLKSTMATVKKAMKAVKIEATREENDGGIKDPLGRAVFSYQGEYNFDEAYDTCFKVLLSTNRKEEEPVYSCLQEKPVRLTRDKEGRISFSELATARSMWAELNKRVTFMRRGDQGDGARGKVPEEVANHVYEQAWERLPQTPEIIYTPLFTADGSLLRRPGYYPETDMLVADIGFEVPKVYSDPTLEEVDDAVALLRDEVLGDFPFLDYDLKGEERREPSLANAMAMLITPFMRRMINSCTPVFFISKPQPGTGGTLLGWVPIVLFDGQEPAPLRYTANEEEMQKLLLASVLETRSHLFFDDVKEYNNRVLLMAITSRHIGGRQLGSTKTIERPNNFGWIATGNNPSILNEMARRIIDIRLNAKTDDVQERTYRHPDYMQWLKANRGEIVHAILTLISHWQNMGSPRFTERKRASFEDWSEKVGGVLQCAGIEGFLDNRRTAAADMDEAAVKQFIREWRRKWGLDAKVSQLDLWSYAFDSEFDIVSGNNDDQKKGRFMRVLPTLEGRTFKMKDEKIMVRSATDADDGVVYYLQAVQSANDDQAHDHAA